MSMTPDIKASSGNLEYPDNSIGGKNKSDSGKSSTRYSYDPVSFAD